jgi:hypothetical protein
MVDAAPIKVQGVVKDSLTNEVLPYASLGFKKYPVGTCSNQNGEFQLIVDDSLSNEMLTVSYLGYESKEYTIKEMDTNYFEILLNPKPIRLAEFSVLPQITGEEILKKVIKNHTRNFPFGFSFYETFFRDLVSNESPNAADKGKICRMTEAAINIEDFGLDSYRDPKYSVHEIRNSFNYVEDSKHKYFETLGGIESPVSWIYRSTTFVSMYYLKKLLKDDCYSKEIIGLTEFDGTPVYILELRKKYMEFLGMKIEMNKTKYSDILYVNSKNWAIQEAKHIATKDSLSYRYKFELKMQEFGGKYYPKLLEYDGIITDEYGKLDETHYYKHKAYILVNNIVLDRKSIERIRRRNAMKTDLPLWNMEYKYNPEFWNTYNILLDKPIDPSVKKDLEQEVPLDNQFIDGGIINAKKITP